MLNIEKPLIFRFAGKSGAFMPLGDARLAKGNKKETVFRLSLMATVDNNDTVS